MNNHPHNCCVCNQPFPQWELFPVDLLNPPIVDLIVQHHTLAPRALICSRDLKAFYRRWRKHQMVSKTHDCELDDISFQSFEDTLLRAGHIEDLEELTFGERLADRVADFGGSWTFITSFGLFLVLWMLINTFTFFWRPFDPYPYIFLNLILSCLAAIQAPIIMMSQNRQESRDRLRGELDYHINLQAGLEIQDISAKLDHIGKQLWEKLAVLEAQTQQNSDPSSVQ